MKKLFLLISAAMSLLAFVACSKDDVEEGVVTNPETPANPEIPSDSSQILVAYFSWSGNTEAVAKRISELTGGMLYEIQPATPYTTDYQTLAYTVARTELDTDARPALNETDADFSNYQYVFLGCPVWWGTAPMIMSSFCETYNFEGKTVIPFCTFLSAGRDATIQKLISLTPGATHLSGFGVSGANTSGVEGWLREINMIE